MSRHALSRTLSLSLLLCAAAAAAEPPSRLATAIDPRASATLSGSVRPQAQARYEAGRVDGGTILHGSLELRPSPAQQAELDELLREQQDPVSPSYHAWLTPQQYGARFGLSAQDLNRIEAWLRGQGLSVEGADSGGNHIGFSGSAARLEAAFQTELHRYQVDGESHFANAGELSLPAALSGMVAGVRGLDDFRPRPHLRQVPAFTSNISGNHYLSPGDIATIYDITPLYGASITGSGRKIAVVGQSAILLHDVQAFRSAAGLPANDPVMMLVPNTGASTVKQSSGDELESDLDVEWSGGVARDASIVFVYSGASGDVFTALQYAITQTVMPVIPVISISYGNCEAGNSGNIPTVESWLMQANAQGQTVIASSGDSGAADCEQSKATVASNGLAVDYPASSPEVTGVGGTEFNEGSNTAAYWSGGKGSGADVISSAKSYIPEIAWNDTGSSSGAVGLSATGGGVSTYFITKPVWQTGAGVPADGARDVPDLALSASPEHDGYLYCTSDVNGQGSCVNGFRNNDAQTTLSVAGGTSFGAPVFAGMLSLVEQKAGLAGAGNINPRLYPLAGSAAFHDIVSGNNKVPCKAATPDCPSGGSIGYVAGPGYDQVTGLGSVDVNNLAQALSGSSGSSSSSSSGSSGSSSSSSSSSGGSSSSSSSSSSSGSSGSSTSSSSSSSSSGSSGSGGGGGGGGGGGSWAPLTLVLLAGLAIRRRRAG